MTTETKSRKLKNSRESKGIIYDRSLITDYDIHLFKEGNNFRIFDKFGSHLRTVDNAAGTHFAVWAPNAETVSVVGDFNGWNPESHPLGVRWDGSGIWEGFLPGITKGSLYKYHITSKLNDYEIDKTDPLAFYWEIAPKTASCVWDLDYQWEDHEWMRDRSEKSALNSPISVYEVHPGSWRRVPEEYERSLTYRELAHQLADYVKDMGFTHVELLPVMEHPFYGSWGYQTLGYFAPTSRYGTPQDFMYLVDYLHQQGIGVILDWVPSHFPSDEHGLANFDGSHLYEHADPRKGFHPEWSSYIFNYGRNEVRNFLISSAVFWLEKYHIDGLRVDAVASLLYLDYSREEGEWIPNEYGGRENMEAISFLRRLNEVVYGNFPGVQTIAEESTDWPMVSRPTYVGGLGFGMKWNMGWMHDTLEYFSKDPVHRKHHHNQLTFSIWYAFSENFILSLSHDEVVYGKGSLLAKMPGDDWQKFANLRLLFGYLYTHPGKKLLFMGGELGQWQEWDHESSLSWHLLQYAPHQGIQRWVRELSWLYRNEPALYEQDFENEGFEWVGLGDWEQSTISFLRKGKSSKDLILVICNLTPVPRNNYRVGIPAGGYWKEMMNSDAEVYGGSGQGNFGGVEASPVPSHGRDHSLSLTLPPLAVVVFKKEISAPPVP
ncbi:MAG: 1,4-alpha-glucan branching protein GlgB [Deltaproteobacteria bacterium]|nr:MAG: 1,4-alpha-glucan branching protein GlgB [Deltaproteobacteria bacterium]